MNKLHQVPAYKLTSLNMALVNVSIHTKTSRQSIGYDRTTGFAGVTYKSVQTRLGHVEYTTKSDTSNVIAISFGCYNNHGLFQRQSANNPFFIAAPVGFVYLDRPFQAISPRSNHGSSHFVHQRPGHFITAQTKSALQPLGADPVLLTCYILHSPEPWGQQQMTILKNSAPSNRNLMAAGT